MFGESLLAILVVGAIAGWFASLISSAELNMVLHMDTCS